MECNKLVQRIALGTAQFGLNYGIANKQGQISTEHAKTILQISHRSGINTLDTAIAYGNSEVCLGKIGVENFKIITKLPPVPNSSVNIERWVHEQIQPSFSRLKVKKIYGLLLHRPDQLLTPFGEELYKNLLTLKTLGLVEKIGVSIYNPQELLELIANYKLDLVQAPFNIIDRRLYLSGWLQRLNSLGIEIHTRSTFLQGLLLMVINNIPKKFELWNSLWKKWRSWLCDNNISALKACLLFPLTFTEIKRVIVGVDSLVQLKQIIDIVKVNEPINFPDFNCNDEMLVNPVNWK